MRGIEKYVVLSISILAMFWLVNSCSRKPAYEISLVKDGYVIQVPTEIMKDFPEGMEIQVELDDPKRGKTAVTGKAVRMSDTTFKILSGKRLNFTGGGNAWMLLRIVTGVDARRECSGCPRDSTLKIYMDASMCWCWSS